MQSNMPAPHYVRKNYLDRIRPFIGQALIKVLVGQRRAGKSYLLRQIAQHIVHEHPDANLIFINKELQEFAHIRTHSQLYDEVKKQLHPTRPCYLFVDEVQEITEFQLALRSLLAEQLCDIYCTGSNAQLLSGELATLLAGRYIELRVHPFSYAEFLEFRQLSNHPESLQLYLAQGGMPYITANQLSQEAAYEYLRNVRSSVLLKDVVARQQIRNVRFLENLVEFLANNTGSLLSANNISKYLKAQGVALQPQQIISYLHHLGSAFLVNRVQRYDVQGLQIFASGEKYYFEDLGLRNSLRGYSQRDDIQKLLENAVFVHLQQRGYEVFVGRIGEYEIDFVALRNGLKLYVQVAYLLTEQSTIDREFGNLQRIPDNYPKMVVTLDTFGRNTNYKGIEQVFLGDFLLREL